MPITKEIQRGNAFVEVPIVKKRVAILTLGCSKNVVDSETMAGYINSTHHQLVAEAEQADSLIINTCGFIDLAKEESIQAILSAVELKKSGRLKELIVAGCLSERYAESLKQEIPEVDHFFGTEAYGSILKALSPDLKYSLLGERVLSSAKHYAYIKISEGCDNPCSFCAIPLMRGGHKSKPIEKIIAEVTSLVRQGVKEFVLVAQDLTYYGLDLYGKRRLDDLLKHIADVPGVVWLRCMYAYPAKFPREILSVIRERENICKYIDMPLQHISTDVLKSMRRGITRRATEELIGVIRQEVPGIALRTTFIIGYPNETESAFQELCEFVEETKFDRMGVFLYSQEDDTYAHILGDSVPADVKEFRREKVMEIQREISSKKNAELVGTVQRVIIDDEINGEFLGRTEHSAPEVDNEVYIKSSRALAVGDFVDVEIDDSSDFELYARSLPKPG